MLSGFGKKCLCKKLVVTPEGTSGKVKGRQVAGKIEKFGLNDLCLQLKRERKTASEAAATLSGQASQQAGKLIKITAKMVYDSWRAITANSEQVTNAIIAVAAAADPLPAFDLMNIGPLFADPARELDKHYRRLLSKLDEYEAVGIRVHKLNNKDEGEAEVFLSKEWVALAAQVTIVIKAAVDIKEKALTHERIAQILEIAREAAELLSAEDRRRYLEYWQTRLQAGAGA